MSQLTSFILDAFEDHLNSLATIVVIEGKEYNALPAETELSPNLDTGGVTDTLDGMVIVRKADFTTLPKVGTRIRVDNLDARLAYIKTQANEPVVTLGYIGASER